MRENRADWEGGKIRDQPFYHDDSPDPFPPRKAEDNLQHLIATLRTLIADPQAFAR